MGLIPSQIDEGPRWAYTAADRRRPQKGNAASEKRAPQMGLSSAADRRRPQNGKVPLRISECLRVAHFIIRIRVIMRKYVAARQLLCDYKQVKDAAERCRGCRSKSEYEQSNK